jgi:hypothetical protein
MPVIQSIREAEVGGSQSKTSLAKSIRCYLKRKKKLTKKAKGLEW